MNQKNEKIEELFNEDKNSQVSSNNLNRIDTSNLNQVIDKNQARNNLLNHSEEIENYLKIEEQKNLSQSDNESNSIIKGNLEKVDQNKVEEAEADPTLKKELSNIIMKKLLSRKLVIAGLLITLIIVFIIILVVLNTTVKDDYSEINTSNEVINTITGDLDISEITGYLVYYGLCRDLTDENEEIKECKNSGIGKFLTEFQKVYKNYKQYKDKNDEEIELDIPLILETISYNRSDDDLVNLLNSNSGYNKIIEELNELAQAQVEYIQEYGDYYDSRCRLTKDKKIGTAYYRISYEKYISYLKYGEVHENYSNQVRLYDAKIHPESEEKCIPEGESYSPPSNNGYQSE